MHIVLSMCIDIQAQIWVQKKLCVYIPMYVCIHVYVHINHHLQNTLKFTFLGLTLDQLHVSELLGPIQIILMTRPGLNSQVWD